MTTFVTFLVRLFGPPAAAPCAHLTGRHHRCTGCGAPFDAIAL